MRDKEFLEWIRNRLVLVHHENGDMDYMHKLQSIIDVTPPDKETPNTGDVPRYLVHCVWRKKDLEELYVAIGKMKKQIEIEQQRAARMKAEIDAEIDATGE
jgi:hypothetical protein